jgi:hypothetical protein
MTRRVENTSKVIVDPLKVVRTALVDASGVASLFRASMFGLLSQKSVESVD